MHTIAQSVGAVQCGVVWFVVWCDVVWPGSAWRGGAARRGVVRCGVPKALLPNGNGQDGLARGNMQAGRALCSVLRTWGKGANVPRQTAVSVQGRQGDALPFRLLVQLKLPHCLHHHVPWPGAGFGCHVLWRGPARPSAILTTLVR